MAPSVVRVRSSHQITAAMEAPTVTEIARRMAGTLKGPDSCAFSMYPSAKRSTWYSISVSRPAAAPMAMPTMATAAISPGIRADSRLLFRLVLRLLRHHCFSHVACTSSPVRLIGSYYRIIIVPPTADLFANIPHQNMNSNVSHTTCVCIVNGRSGSSSSATRPATSAKHHKAYSGRFIGGKYIGIYSIQDTRCTK